MLAGVSVRHNNQVDSFYLKAYRISWRESSKKTTWWLTFVQVRCRRVSQVNVNKQLKGKEKRLVLWAEGALGSQQGKSGF